MPRQCTICIHAQKEEINAALLAGEPFRHIASRFDTSTGALQRHKADHLPVQLVKAREAGEVAQADDLLSQVRNLQKRAQGILDQAEAAGDLRTALAAIRETRGTLELLARLLGELQEQQVVNVLISPQWVTVRAAIVRALEPFPKARLAVSKGIQNAGG